MPVIPATPEAIRRAAAVLREGGVVAFPTETVYGLGANALDPHAVARIFEIKRRPSFDPLIVHVVDEAMLARVVSGVSTRARELIDRFWPGALTLVLPRNEGVPKLVSAGLPTVAVRMPSHPVARDLLLQTNLPLAAPSANRFGSLSPTRAEHVENALGDAVDLILDDGPTPLGVESTIVMPDPIPTLLRPGAVPVEEVEVVTGQLVRELRDEHAPRSPGRLEHHYAPRTPLRLLTTAEVPLAQRSSAGFLGISLARDGYAEVQLLSISGDMREAAARLFDALHTLDALGLERIDAEPVSQEGLGLAIMDRLRRAAEKNQR